MEKNKPIANECPRLFLGTGLTCDKENCDECWEKARDREVVVNN